MQCSLRETLGTNLVYAKPNGLCSQCKQNDRGGRHQSSCKRGHVAKIRHKDLVKIIAEFSNAAGAGPTTLEPAVYDPNQQGIQTNPQRCDHLVPFLRDKPVYTDVSVTDTTAPTNQPQQPTQGHKAAIKYKLKVDKYEDLCKANGGEFLPLIFESSGHWHPKTKKTMKKLAAMTATRQTGLDNNPTLTAAIYRYWATRISVAIIKNTYYYAASNATSTNNVHQYHYY